MHARATNVILALVSLVFAASAQGHPTSQGSFSDAIGGLLFGTQTGCDGTVYAIHRAPSGLIYFGGDFALCDDVYAKNVVAFDPQTRRFSALGSGLDGTVRSIVDDGSGLYFGGEFSYAGELRVNHLARWSGRQWEAIGEPSNVGVSGSTIRALAWHDGKLYVGGRFDHAGATSARNVAQWDGQRWSAMSDGLGSRSEDQVNALVFSAGSVYAGGQFEFTEGLRYNHVAHWDGARWVPLRSGDAIGVSNAFVTVLRSNAEGLLVAGPFQMAGDQPGTRYLAQWNGNRWAGVGFEGILQIDALIVVDDAIYISGYRADLPGHSVWFFDGEKWRELPEIQSEAYALAMIDAELYISASRRWNGNEWLAVGNGSARGVVGAVNAIASSDEYLYFGGRITQVDGLSVRSIARWNGSQWSALVDENGEGILGTVYALAVDGERLYVGGRFSRAGGVDVANIAVWENERWSALGDGLGASSQDSVVETIAVGNDEVYVGGSFRSAGSVVVNGIAQWSGSGWQPLPEDLSLGADQAVRVSALKFAGHDLYVAGGFDAAGAHSDVNGVARWDGQRWFPLGSGLRYGHGYPGVGKPAFLSVVDGSLYVAGYFYTAGGVATDGFARWDGAAWSNPLATSDYALLSIAGFAEYDGTLYFSAAVYQQPDGQRFTGGLFSFDGENLRLIGRRPGGMLEVAMGNMILGSSAGPTQSPAANLLSRSVDAMPAADQAVINRNGQFVAFRSLSSVATQMSDDVWLTELATGKTSNVSSAIGTIEQGYTEPSLSADGSTLAVTGSSGQIYTLRNGVARMVSASVDGRPGNAPSQQPALSGNGRHLAFTSLASNLHQNDVASPTEPSIFVKDLRSGAVKLVSYGASTSLSNGASRQPSLTDDGLLVVFSTLATNLTLPSESTGHEQVFMIRDTSFGEVRRYLSRNPQTGMLGNGPSTSAQVTPDGRYGVFESTASNLVPGDNNGVSDIFRFEINSGVEIDLQRVSVSALGLEGNGPSRNPSISDDGQTISFETDATNLVAFDRNDESDVVVKWMGDGSVVRLAATFDGSEPAGASVQPQLAGDGSALVFVSDAFNLDLADEDSQQDIYSVELRDRRQSVPNVPIDEPRVSDLFLASPTPSFAACPSGYFTAEVVDGPGADLHPGIFGLELLLDDPGTRELSGGLNFGGLIDRGQPGFAGVNITNEADEAQLLQIELRGSPAIDESGILQVDVVLNRRTATTVERIYQANVGISLTQPLLHQLPVSPGYYEVTVTPSAGEIGGAAEGAFYFSLTTQFLDRPGGGFQGGAVVGGYHAEHPFGGVSGFAALCLATPHSVSARVLSHPSYGQSGARDLRLRILDVHRQTVISTPTDS